MIAVEYAVLWSCVMLPLILGGTATLQSFSVNQAATFTAMACAAVARASGTSTADAVVAADTTSLFSSRASVTYTLTQQSDVWTCEVSVTTPTLVPWNGPTLSLSVTASD
jgi:hypothetical protein